jgi:hypothetical protein
LRRFAFLAFIILLYSPSIYAQDWHFVDETSTRLPDTMTVGYGLDGGDINGDGSIDLLEGCHPGIWPAGPGFTRLFYNSGAGYFTMADSTQYPQVDNVTNSLNLLDCDLDGNLDAFVVNAANQTDYIAINSGNGNFTIAGDRFQEDSGSGSVSSYSDIDGDGDIDLCMLGNDQPNQHPHRLWINDCTGHFQNEMNRMPSLYPYYQFIGFADLNGDLCPDIVAAYRDDQHSLVGPEVFINDGNGNFANETSQRLPQTEGCSKAVLSDIDNDGDIDIVLNYVARCGFLINDGTGHFTDETQERGPVFPDSLRAVVEMESADVDNDGDEDLVLGTYSICPDLLLINNGLGYFSDSTQTRWPNQANSTQKIFLGDLDNDGDCDIFRVGDGYCRNSIFINTIDVPDSIPPHIMNQTILPVIDTTRGPYPVRLIAKDGISIPYQLSVHVHYSTDRINYQSDSMHYTGAYIYFGTIPEIDSGESVYYYFTAKDKWNNISYAPLNAPESVFSFIYLPGYEGTDEDGGPLPEGLNIYAYPNPFNAQTTISYNLPKASEVSLDIFDIIGRKIETIAEGHQDAGEHSIIWNAGDKPSGIYFYRLKAGERIKTNRMVLLK